MQQNIQLRQSNLKRLHERCYCNDCLYTISIGLLDQYIARKEIMINYIT